MIWQAVVTNYIQKNRQEKPTGQISRQELFGDIQHYFSLHIRLYLFYGVIGNVFIKGLLTTDCRKDYLKKCTTNLKLVESLVLEQQRGNLSA